MRLIKALILAGLLWVTPAHAYLFAFQERFCLDQYISVGVDKALSGDHRPACIRAWIVPTLIPNCVAHCATVLVSPLKVMK
jgi:hypothetical protein